MIDLIRCAVKNIFRRRSRALITVLGIAIGMCSVVLVSAVGDVGKNMIEQELSGFGAGSLTVSVDKSVSNLAIGDDQVQTLSAIDGVEEVSPMAVEYSYVSSRGYKPQCRLGGGKQKKRIRHKDRAYLWQETGWL